MYQDYEPQTLILNQLGLFFKALLEKGLMEKTKKTKGCKKSKQRITVTFIVASDGSFFFELIVFWRSKRPRCFKSLKDPSRPMSVNYFFSTNTAQKMKFSIKDFFSKCDQIRRKLRIWSHLLKKSLMENFTLCAVSYGLIAYSLTQFISLVFFCIPRKYKKPGVFF